MNKLAGQLRLDFRAEDPIYVQIVRQIETLVAGGTLKPGDQLPTVRELAIDLRINFSTVARAYHILDEQRLISTQRGRGTYIWEQAPQEMAAPGELAAVSPPAPEALAAPAAHAIGENRVTTELLAGLAQRFISEAATAGASAEQIEQVFQQQIAGWKRDHPAQLNQPFGGK